MTSLVAQLVKNPPAVQDTWIPGLGRSPEEGKGYPLQYSGLDEALSRLLSDLENQDLKGKVEEIQVERGMSASVRVGQG